MFLFFDTETTGLPRNWKAPVTNVSNWPRMVQVAWILSNKKGERIHSESMIIKPEDYQIPEKASKIHGITTEKAIEEGKDLEEVLIQFNDLIEQTKFIVAHNINFDEKILGAELIRKNIKSNFNNRPKICTMKNTTDFCRIPGPYGFKWP